MSNKVSENTTNNYIQPSKFFDYDNISLKLFISIAETANYLLLSIDGSSDINDCFDQWEKIVQQNSKVNGNAEYRSYYDNLYHYNKLLKDFNAIKATITILYFEVDNDLISYLDSKGYKISTHTSLAYVESLNAAMNKSNQLITKIEMRSKAILKANEQSKGSNQQLTFETLMANLTIALGFNIDDSITLARYNDYNKIIKKNNEQNRKKK